MTVAESNNAARVAAGIASGAAKDAEAQRFNTWRTGIEKEACSLSNLFEKLGEEERETFVRCVHDLVDMTLTRPKREILYLRAEAMGKSGALARIHELGPELSQEWGSKPQGVNKALRKATEVTLEVILQPNLYDSVAKLVSMQGKAKKTRSVGSQGRTHHSNEAAPPSTFHNSLRRRP